MSYRFRIRASITSVVLAVSVFGSAIPLRPVSRVFEATLAGFARSSAEPPSAQRKAPPQPSAEMAPPAETDTDPKRKQGAQFTIYRETNGEVVCRDATTAERREMGNPNLEGLGMRPINHLETIDKTREVQPSAAPNLTIILRATQQLQNNADAKSAFTRAAQNWENVIKSPVTIYIDVDFGTRGFGETFQSGVLGATATASHSYPYSSARTNLIAEASGEGNATKQEIFNGLPSSVIPSDRGDVSASYIADPNARAIGLLPATAQSQDETAQIAFNSSFTFDFDPTDGISAGAIDFDAVATHEIGHALGFSSEAGTNLVRASIWDFYRFRTGATTSTFTTAQRLLTIGGSPDPLQFFFVPGNVQLGLSTGGSDGATLNGADGWQSSHWKHVSGCNPAYIGIMDPAIPSGCRRAITDKDRLALISFGYNLTNNNPPPPAPPPPSAPANDNFVNSQVISGCSGTVNGTNFSATSETGEPSHDPPDATSRSPVHTVWYQWQAPATGRVNLDTGGSEFDTILAVYTGNVVNGLTRIVFNDDIDPGVIQSSSVTFTATAGTTYRIVVDGWGGEQGGIKLNWSSCAAPSPSPTPSPTPTPTPTPVNPIDQAVFFVRRHYLDFLNREPDQSGWDFWTNQITSCGTNLQCTEARRIDVSASFFLSIEFQQSGYLVEWIYKVAYGDASGTSTFGSNHQLMVPMVRFNEFQQGTQRIGQGVIVLQTGWEQLLESNKLGFAQEFVQTTRFTAANAFPTSMPPTQFVDKLNQNAGNVLSASERTTAINLFNGAADTSNTVARAQALRQVAEDVDLYNAEYNRAFVLAQYYGYLRRNPNDAPDSDYTGYDFWLTKLNQFNGNYINAEMVKAFLSSIEYRQRFGP